MKYGYARVSTKDQILDMQIDALKKAGCDKIFLEVAKGAKADRPEWTALLNEIQAGSYCQMLCMKKIRQHIFSHLSYRY